MTAYSRTPEELRKHAILYWPTELAEQEKTASVIPLLLSTQDKFISILHVADSDPEAWKMALAATSDMSANLFLKHLMILSDVGGEPLNRLRTGFAKIFPNGLMKYTWKDNTYEYVFGAIPNASRLNNGRLFVDGRKLHIKKDLDPLTEDVIMLLLYGGVAIEGDIPDLVKDRCMIGSLIGDKSMLEKYIKQRYIWVSRITGGATANTLGQIAQEYVKNIIADELPDPGWEVTSDGTIPGISHNAGKTDINFDVVVKSPRGKYAGIEVCFQFTTNSVIERKGGQAEARRNLLHNADHRIAYVIDGAGNFERMSALSNICNNSDCTVAFSPEEISVLIEFLHNEL